MDKPLLEEVSTYHKMGKVPRLIKWIFNEADNSAIALPINEEDVKESQKIRGLAQELQSKTAQLAEYKAQENENKQRDRDEEIETEIYLKVDELQKKLDEKKFGKSFSFGKFFKAIYGVNLRGAKSKWGKEVEICDKDDEVVFGKFGDIVEIEGGYMGITDDQGNLVSYGKSINSLIWKPDSLNNQMKRKRILLPKDKNGNPALDLENMESPDIVYNEEKGVYEETREKMKLVKEMLIEKEEERREDRVYIERVETQNVNLKNKIRDLERALNVYQIRFETAQTELSKSTEKMLEFDKKMGELYNRNVNLTQIQATSDVWINKLENINGILMDKIENIGNDSKMELARAQIQDLIDFVKSNTQEVTIQNFEQPKEPVQPGQPLQ
jgi:hypothetical protein